MDRLKRNKLLQDCALRKELTAHNIEWNRQRSSVKELRDLLKKHLREECATRCDKERLMAMHAKIVL